MRGISFSAITEATPLNVLGSAGPPLSSNFMASAAPLLTIRGGVQGSRILWLDTREGSEAPIPEELLLSGVRAAWSSDAATLVQSSSTDELYRQAEWWAVLGSNQWPLPCEGTTHV